MAQNANVSTADSTHTVVYSKTANPEEFSAALSSFVTDPSRSVDFSGIPDELEFDSESDHSKAGSEIDTPKLPEIENSPLEKPLVSHSKLPSPISSPQFSQPSSPLRAQQEKSYSPFESPPHSRSFSDDDTDFQDSSFINSSRAQFDLDISIEKKDTQGQHRLSPWRKLGTSDNSVGPLRHSSLLSKRNFTQTSIAETGAAKKIEDLSKQLTNCKIQLKLYEKFLQDLIDRHQIDVGELYELHGNFNGKSTSKLEKEHADMCVLVEDLYASLEEFQGKWRDADKRVADLDHNMHELAFEVSDLLGKVGQSIELDPGQSPKKYLETALSVLKQQIDVLGDQKNEQHEQMVRDIKQEYDTHNNEKVHAEKLIREQIQEISKLKQDHETLQLKYEALQSENATSEFERLRSENDRLSSLNRNVDEKLYEYQVMINQLQREVNEFKDLSRKGLLSDLSEPSVYGQRDRERERERDRDRLLLLQRDYENLQRTYENLVGDFERFKENSASTVASLTNQLNNRKRDIINLRAEHTGLENIQHDYEGAIEKQRLLTLEKMKLAWQVESLTKDKISLQASLERMTEKASKREENGELEKKLGEILQRFEYLVKLDVSQFQRLFKLFNKIADDSSLEGPKKRIGMLLDLVETRHFQNKEDAAMLRENHKSVFDYFARAVETIVNDHIRLLLKESESENLVADASVVSKLEQKVQLLQKQLDQKNQDSGHKQQNSGLAKQVKGLNMRIEELTNRWKAEREARVHDNEQAKRRLQQLEEENERLRR